METNLNLLWAQKLFGVPMTPEEYHEMCAWYINKYVEDMKHAK